MRQKGGGGGWGSGMKRLGRGQYWLKTGQIEIYLHCLERLLKIPKTNLKTFGERSFGYVVLTGWNSLPADLRASPSLPTFKVNLKMHFFCQAFWLICTCQLLPVSYLCVCVHVGGMELRVGSNIMIRFLYILLLLIWHMYLYIIYCYLS